MRVVAVRNPGGRRGASQGSGLVRLSTVPARRPQLSDAESLHRIRSDPDAICALYDRYLAQLLAALARVGGDREAAWDIAQETFARTLERGHRVRLPPDGSAWPWLWSVARNLLRDRQRREQVETSARQRLGIAAVPYDAEAVDDLIDRAELRDSVAAALDGLPLAQRQAVVGRVALDAGYEQLAEVFGTTEDALRARVSRGLRALRLRLSGGRL
jgi:RNA polymerase sigma factor (sigma-70 family)